MPVVETPAPIVQPPVGGPIIKAGVQTTEFWVVLLFGLSPFLSILLKHDVTPHVQTWAEIAAGATTSAYVFGRTLVKLRAIGFHKAALELEATLQTIGETGSVQ